MYLYVVCLQFNDKSASTPVRNRTYTSITNFSPVAVTAIDVYGWPRRLCNDTSQTLKSGYKMNKLQAKGTDRLNSLRQCVLRGIIFQTQMVGDISKCKPNISTNIALVSCLHASLNFPYRTITSHTGYRSFVLSELDSHLRLRVWFSNAATAEKVEDLIPIVAATNVLDYGRRPIMYIFTNFATYPYFSFSSPGDTQASPVLEAGIRIYVAGACITIEARTWVLWERYVSPCMTSNITSPKLSFATQVDNLLKSLFLKWKKNGDIKIVNGKIVYAKGTETLVTQICKDVRQAFDQYSMDLKYIKVTKGCSEEMEEIMKEMLTTVTNSLA